MNTAERFDHCLEHLSEGLGHLDRHTGLRGYCTGLMLPLSRKSVEPMAARVDPMHTSARPQALHHFVAKAEWSHEEMLRRVYQWVIPKMDFARGGWWIIDDTGFPKKGRHSVGVARQWLGSCTCPRTGRQTPSAAPRPACPRRCTLPRRGKSRCNRPGAPCGQQFRQGTTAPRAMAAHRVAGQRRRAEQIHSVNATRGNADQRIGQRRPSALAHRARLPGSEAGLRPGALRGTRLARVPPSCRVYR